MASPLAPAPASTPAAPRSTASRSPGSGSESGLISPPTERSADSSKLFCSVSRLSVSRRDRKSTRLNSSHLVISYAVFCLKKKKYMHVRRPFVVQRVAQAIAPIQPVVLTSSLAASRTYSSTGDIPSSLDIFSDWLWMYENP